MTSVAYNLDAIRETFPTWAVFRSDTGVYYGTRRGEWLTNAQIAAGLEQTVAAEALPDFIALLRWQEDRR
ncbi:hypothetical protein [Microtetraspora sp. NBRC 13810]|uniref:hypothetical protein n=1 Tax=Microtetraspora sp. NBRC 13810 TaxID=3030990 RepID=UPI002556C732|nr:hypothetical protein [Microtetraspora sp. NBRC 13810]